MGNKLATGEQGAGGGMMRTLGFRRVIVTLILAAAISFCVLSSFSLAQFQTVKIASPFYWIGFILTMALAACVLLVLWGALDTFHLKSARRVISNNHYYLGLLIIIISWLTVWLAAWPGYYCYDTYAITDYVSKGVLDGLQPVLHSILCGTLIKLGLVVFDGSWNNAIALYFAFQIVFMVTVLGIILKYLIKQGVSLIFFWVSIAFYALNPLIPMLGICSTKDALFSGVFCLFLLWLIRVLEKGRPNKILTLVFGVSLIFLLTALRSNSFYSLVLFLPAFIIVIRSVISKRCLIQLVACMLIGFCLYGLWNGPGYDMLSVNRWDGARQMINVPAAQTSRMAALGVIDASEAEELGIDINSMALNYSTISQVNSDYFRGQLFNALDNGRTKDYLAWWFRTVLEHPSISLDALMILTQPLWDITTTPTSYNNPNPTPYNYSGTETSLFASWVEWPAQQDSIIPSYSNFLWNISRYNVLQEIPFISLLVSPAAYFWLVIIVAAYAFIRCDYRAFSICLLQLCFLASVFVGPTILLRYVYFVMLTTPILFFMLLRGANSIAIQDERSSWKHFKKDPA